MLQIDKHNPYIGYVYRRKTRLKKMIVDSSHNPFIGFFKHSMVKLVENNLDLMEINEEKHNVNIGYIDRRKDNNMYDNKYFNKNNPYLGYINHVVQVCNMPTFERKSDDYDDIEYINDLKLKSDENIIIEDYMKINEDEEDYLIIEKEKELKKKKTLFNLFGLIK